jgi:hypothetical protein
MVEIELKPLPTVVKYLENKQLVEAAEAVAILNEEIHRIEEGACALGLTGDLDFKVYRMNDSGIQNPEDNGSFISPQCCKGGGSFGSGSEVHQRNRRYISARECRELGRMRAYCAKCREYRSDEGENAWRIKESELGDILSNVGASFILESFSFPHRPSNSSREICVIRWTLPTICRHHA